MRTVFVVTALAACAATTRTCPSESRLANEDLPTGRVEWCARTIAGITAIPVPGRTYPDLFGTAHPSAKSGGFQGPYTHWYPNGAVESHGVYVGDDTASVPDGVWGFWYETGSPKSVGRYTRGRAIGCFALWDEQGNRLTGVVDGDQLRVESCEPPADDALAEIAERSHPVDNSTFWGDLSLHTLVQSGTFGASNTTQENPDPAARGTMQLVLRKRIGDFRVGPALGYRFSSSDDAHAYIAGVAAAYALELPVPRLKAELELQLGAQYLDISARRTDQFGSGSASFWEPLGGARLAASFAVLPTLAIVGGLSIDGSLVHHTETSTQYCAPLCGLPIMETWKLGGAAYGIDIGLQLRLH